MGEIRKNTETSFRNRENPLDFFRKARYNKAGIVNRFTLGGKSGRGGIMAEEKVTIKTIAELAGTSKTTVSFYLNGKFEKMSPATRDRIEAAIAQTRYVPNSAARSLTGGGARLIGVVIGDITNPFSNQIVKGIESVAQLHSYQIVFGSSGYRHPVERRCLERMLKMGAEGFIVQPTPRFGEAENLLEKLHVPVVFFDSTVYGKENCWVKTNNYAAAFETAEACLKKGYEDFLMITADPAQLSTRQERARGFADALDRNGRPCAVRIIGADTPAEEIADFVAGAVRLSRRTLIFVPTCWALPTVHLALKKFMHLMPDSIGLVGFDNTEWSMLVSPSVTTIVQPAYREGQQAMKILADILEREGREPVRQEMNCTVNWCGSTGILPQAFPLRRPQDGAEPFVNFVSRGE